MYNAQYVNYVHVQYIYNIIWDCIPLLWQCATPPPKLGKTTPTVPPFLVGFQ